MDIKFTKQHRDVFKKLGIETIYLFGSYAKGTAHKLSDVDIGVVFVKPEQYKGNTLKVYNKLYRIFNDVLPSDYLKQRFKLKRHEFDIVFLQFSPVSLQFEAIKEAEVLYEQNKEKRFNYEENILKRHCDLKYFYDLSYNCLLERI